MKKRPFPAYKGDEPYVFVSYAHADSAIVYPLLVNLSDRDIKIWYDEGIEPGSKWREELSTAIAEADRFLYVASSASVASANCERELDYALSLDIPVQVCYVEDVELPPSLSFSLGSHQAIVAAHYSEEEFQEKVFESLTSSPERRLGAIAARRRKQARNWVLASASIVLASIATYFLIERITGDDQEIAIPLDIVPSREKPVLIAVRPLMNVTGNDGRNWLGEALANRLRDNLSSSRFAVVTSAATWMRIEDESDSELSIHDRAKALNVDYLISGELLENNNELLATMRVTNLRANIDVMTQSYPNLTAEALVEASERITLNVKQAMKIPREDELLSLSADFYTENIAAYEAYINGLQDYNRFAYGEAEKDLQAALLLSPDFHIARYRLADILDATGRREQAIKELAEIGEDAQLDQRENLYVNGLKQTVTGDLEAAKETYESILALFPYEIEAQQLLAQVLFNSYEEEESIKVLNKLIIQEPANPHVLGALGYQLTSIGKLEEAETTLAEYARLFPEQSNAWELYGSLKLRRGDIAGAISDYETALTHDPEFMSAKIGLAKANALSGELQQSADMFAEIVSNEELTARYRIDAGFDLAYISRAVGKSEAIPPMLEEIKTLIADEGVRLGLYWYVLSQSQSDKGDVATALEYLQNGVRDTPPEGVPTRFLHERGILKIQRGQSIEAEIAELRNYRLPEDDPDRTEDKAIFHLMGLKALNENNLPLAIENLQKSTDLYGYEYGIYDVDLANALNAANQKNQALNILKEIEQKNNSNLSGDVRLDLLWHLKRSRTLRDQIEG